MVTARQCQQMMNVKFAKLLFILTENVRLVMQKSILQHAKLKVAQLSEMEKRAENFFANSAIQYEITNAAFVTRNFSLLDRLSITLIVVILLTRWLILNAKCVSSRMNSSQYQFVKGSR